MGKLQINALCWLVLAFVPGMAQPSSKVCEPRVATLSRTVAVPSDTDTGPSVEIRRCPFEHSGIGTIQLVAWKRDAKEPSVVYDVVSGSILQLAMIWGVYAFELDHGRATALVVIEFKNGEPHLAIEQYVRDGAYTFTSTSERLVVQWTDIKGTRQRKEFVPDAAP